MIASGVIPQISLIMGPCAGGAVYSPAITDFTLMVEETSHMFITGPDVIKTVTGEEVTFEELGGAHAHNVKSGVAHYQATDEDDCLDFARALLSYLPSNNLDEPPVPPRPPSPAVALEVTDADAELDTLIPDSPNQPYDMHTVIEHVLDDGEFLEMHAAVRAEHLVGFGRVEGRPVGVVANQPMHFAGMLDIDASEKAARFVRTCDAFNIPVLTFVDVPGFLPGTDQEWGGIIRRGAKLIYAYAEATVPEGHGDHPQGVRRRLRRDGLQAPGRGHQPGVADRADRGDGRAGRGQHPLPPRTRRRRGPGGARAQRVAEYEDTLANPYIAAERGYVDAVIRPSETRSQIDPGAARAPHQAPDPAAQEARQHPAMTLGSGEASGRPRLR